MTTIEIQAARLRHREAVDAYQEAAGEAALHHEEELRANEEVRRIRAELELHVNSQTDEHTGKPLYPNEGARAAAVTVACYLDERYTEAAEVKLRAATAKARALTDAEAAMERAKGERAYIAALGRIAGTED